MDDRWYSVSELASASGVTVRTLHHYDQIGLVVASARSDVGHRRYSSADARRLADVLAFRACGVPLLEVRALLDAEGEDRVSRLRRQLALLDERAGVVARQRAALLRELEAEGMGIELDPEELLEVFGEHDPREHAAEARERWGDTDAYRESHRRTSTYTKQDWLRVGEEAAGVDQEFAACLQEGLPAGSPRAMAAAEAHRRHIDAWFYPCSYEMQTGLADMYVADERFTARYEAISPGLAGYVRDAIWANAVAQSG